MSELEVSGEETAFPEGPVLALDTSTASMTMAVAAAGEVLGERSLQTERNHSVRLLPEIELLLGSLGLKPRDLQAIAVGCGPGSYTGVRIGVTVAKTLAWSIGIPLYGVSSLEALAMGGWRDAVEAGAVDASAAWVVPVLDGRRGQAYTALFAAGAELDGARPWERLGADAILPFRQQAETWLGAPEQPGAVVFVGETDGAFAEVIDAAAAGSQALAVRRAWALAARDVAAAARRQGARALVAEAHDLLPNYTQLAEAEAKLLARAQE